MSYKNQKYDDSVLIKWISNSQKIGSDIVSDIFCIYLESMIKNDWKGACHDLSASFYMTLSEYGLKPTLCIGVVCLNGSNYDHSWVEIGGEVYDFSICHQNHESAAPVFASINLDEFKASNLTYGVRGVDLGEPAKTIADLSIDEYQKIRPKNDMCIYEIASNFGSIIPSPDRKILKKNELRARYSSHKRVRMH
jgi:hypothetical protein